MRVSLVDNCLGLPKEDAELSRFENLEKALTSQSRVPDQQQQYPLGVC